MQGPFSLPSPLHGVFTGYLSGGASISFDVPLSVDDDAAVSTVIAQASVSGDGGPYTFTLTNDAGGQFAINSSTGVITVAAALTAGAQGIGISATNGVDDPVTSAPSVSVNSLPVNTVAPSVSAGVAGDEFTATPGTWTGFPTPVITGQWRLAGADIVGEDGLTYQSLVSDTGALVYRETATNVRGSVSEDSNGVSIGLSTFRRDISEIQLTSMVREDYTAEFAYRFNSGFCLYTKFVVPSDLSNEPTIFYGRERGSLHFYLLSNGQLRISNWTNFQTGTRAFSSGDIVSVFVRHASGTTTIHSQIEGEGSATLESSASRTYNISSISPSIIRWGGRDASAFLNSLYDSAVWLSNITQISEADGLDLISGAQTIGDVSEPSCWFGAETGADKAENMPLMKNWASLPSGQFFSGSDIPGTNPDNFVVLRDPSTMAPVQYDAGSGLRYWAAYNDNLSGVSVRLATSTDLETWVDDSEAVAAASGMAVSDFIYVGGETGLHKDFFLFYSKKSGTEAQVHLTTSDDMSTWTDDVANPVFTNASGPGDGIEDFRMVKVDDNYWAAFYEQDGYEDAGARAVGAALHTGTVPEGGSWTNQTDDILGTSDVGYEIAGHFMANPCVCKDGSDIWLFYEGAVFSGNEPVTLARKITPSANSDVFTPSNWQKFGVANWRNGEKAFGNCASVESGTIYLYLQAGTGATSSASDGIAKQAFNPDIAVEV